MRVLSYLLHVILERRVSEGDKFLSKAAHTAKTSGGGLPDTAFAAPAPKYNVTGFERAYYCAQFAVALTPAGNRPFESRRSTRCSLQEFLTRIFSFSSTVSNACYVVMLLFLERAMLRHPALFLHSGNANRIIFGSFICASKVVEDFYTSNVEFAELGGLSQQDVNQLEIEFLDALCWQTGITKEEFEQKEIDIMVEAIDTPFGNHVLGVLEGENILGLDKAVLQTKAWGCLGMRASKQIANSTVLSCFWRSSRFRLHNSVPNGPSLRIVASGIASAILDAKFPSCTFDLERGTMLKDARVLAFLRNTAFSDLSMLSGKTLSECHSPASIAIGNTVSRVHSKVPMRRLGQYF